jgi:hypothetical protein
MPHYTLLSGKITDTYTSRCPICLKIKYYDTLVEDFTDRDMCCSNEHLKVYEKNLKCMGENLLTWYADSGRGSKTSLITLSKDDEAKFNNILTIFFNETVWIKK